MSTNYYLRHQPCPHCNRADTEDHIFKWPSGFQALVDWTEDAEGSTPFIRCGSWAEWKAHLAAAIDAGSRIFDEYDVPLTLDDFATIVDGMPPHVRRGTFDWHRRHRPSSITIGPALDSVWLDPDGFSFVANEFS